MKTELHPFERAELGIAPFKFVGVREELFQAIPGQPYKPAGSCEYCGTAIRDCYYVQSSDGKTFKVGSECVNKLAKSDNEKRDPVIAAIHREARRLKRERRTASEQKRVKAAKAYLAEHRAEFEAEPHAMAEHWEWVKDQTLEDQYEWSFANAGLSGQMRVTKLIEKRQK